MMTMDSTDDLPRQTVYIDESGNTGDPVVRPGKPDPFTEQPSFTLAAVGFCSKDAEVEKLINAYREKYRIQGAELKGARVVKSARQRGLLLDLITEIEQRSWPVFIEVMDKRYFVAANMVRFTIFGEFGGYSNEAARTANAWADVIFHRFDKSIYELYSRAALSRSAAILDKFFASFAQEADRLSRQQIHPTIKTILEQQSQAAALRRKQLRKQKGRRRSGNSPAFLPPPDYNKRGEILAFLPHIAAINHLLARLNKYAPEGLDIVHDEQHHFDELIEEYNQIANSNEFAFLDDVFEREGTIWRDTVRYTVDREHSLRFVRSDESVCLQVADLLAAFSRWYYNECVRVGLSEVPDDMREAAAILRRISNRPDSCGVNVVTSSKRTLATFYPNQETIPD